MFSFAEKCFPKVIAISQLFTINLGMLFNLRGLQEMFSFIKKLNSKIFSHFPILPIFGEFGVIFL